MTGVGDFAAQAIHRAADLRDHTFERSAKAGGASDFVRSTFNHGDHRHQFAADGVGQLAGWAGTECCVQCVAEHRDFLADAIEQRSHFGDHAADHRDTIGCGRQFAAQIGDAVTDILHNAAD